MDLNNLVNPANVHVMQRIINDFEAAEEEVLNMRQEVYPVESDPFVSLSDEKFVKFYRLSKTLVRELINVVQPFIRPATNEFSLSVQTKILIALHFFATGSYQSTVGANLHHAASQSSASRAIEEVCLALNREAIFKRWTAFPRNIQELNNIRLRFLNEYRFPNIIGCIDCTHVAIVRPQVNEHVYVNRKMYHSLNVQLICDDNLKIINVNSRYPGSVNDARIWHDSNVYDLIRQLHENYPNEYLLLGDSGYPLRPWLLTPIANPPPGSPSARYNNAQMCIRSLIERCNGVLKNRFRCLLKHRVLHYSPEKAAHIVNACVVLHNMCIEHNLNIIYNDGEQEVTDIDELGMIHEQNEANIRAAANPDLLAGRALRNHIINHYFT